MPPYKEMLMHSLLNQPAEEAYDAVLVATAGGQGPALAQAVRGLSSTVQ